MAAPVAVVGDVGAGGVVGLGVAPVVAVEGVGGRRQRVVLRGRGIWVKDFGRRRALGRKVVLSEKTRGKGGDYTQWEAMLVQHTLKAEETHRGLVTNNLQSHSPNKSL